MCQQEIFFFFEKKLKIHVKSSLSAKCFLHLNVCAYHMQWLFAGMAGLVIMVNSCFAFKNYIKTDYSVPHIKISSGMDDYWERE